MPLDGASGLQRHRPMVTPSHRRALSDPLSGTPHTPAAPDRSHPEGAHSWRGPLGLPGHGKVIAGIESHDRACIALGIEFIEEDQHFTFGKILKSNTARALRRADLTEGQIGRLRKRIVQMLVNGNVPHEFKQYAKLLRKIGVGDLWPEIEKVPRTNPYVMRWCQYLWEQRALGSHRLDRGNS